MKKSLIAVAVASAFIAPAAMADVTISGAIALGVYYAKSSDTTGATGTGYNETGIASNYSHIDIESVDDIGNGNKIVFHYQMQVNPENAGADAGNPVNRNSFMSVQGGWGGIYYGTNENVYERHMYQADPLDGAQGVGGNLQLLGTPGGAVFQTDQTGNDFYRRTDNTIWYVSPNINGFNFEVDYSMAGGSKTAAGLNPVIISIGGKYAPDGMPFYADLAYESHSDYNGNGSKDTGIQVGVGYTIADLSLHARYEQLKYKDNSAFGGAGTEAKRNAYWFGAKYNVPTGYVGAQIGIAGEREVNGVDVANTDATSFGIGYFHNLTKQSQMYVIGSAIANKDAANYILAGSSTPNTGVGADHTAITVGIKHTF